MTSTHNNVQVEVTGHRHVCHNRGAVYSYRAISHHLWMICVRDTRRFNNTLTSIHVIQMLKCFLNVLL